MKLKGHHLVATMCYQGSHTGPGDRNVAFFFCVQDIRWLQLLNLTLLLPVIPLAGD